MMAQLGSQDYTNNKMIQHLFSYIYNMHYIFIYYMHYILVYYMYYVFISYVLYIYICIIDLYICIYIYSLLMKGGKHLC